MKTRLIFLLSLIATLTSYSQDIRSPEEFLGYPLGEKFTRHHRIVDYFKYVGEVHPNVKTVQYGVTNEERPLIVSYIASEENFARLDQIRKDNLIRAGLEEGSPTSENAVAIVWLSYTVHGNESSSSEAALKTLYALISGEDQRVDEWLKNTIVIMDPCINPDGRDRWTNHYYQYRNKTPNPDLHSKEHNEVWPGGRTNHYLFDLNRDWAWVTQLESQQRLTLYNQWMPHVHVDFHEQGLNSPYYFPPAAQPYHEIITDWQKDFQKLIGKNHASYFDKEGWIYFTKESFDLLYPSYGDTYPTYNGAIGMTYEKGGGASVAALMENKDTVTLHDRLQHHFITGMSTIEVASTNADRLTSEFSNYFKGNVPSAKYNSYVIKETNNKDRIKMLKEWLDVHKIQYGNSSSRKPLNGYNYTKGTDEQFSLSANDLVISLNQPKSHLIKSLFEPETYLVDTLTYDITAWSVPYAFGLETYAVSERLSMSELKQEELSGIKIDAERPYAYILANESLEDQRFLAQLFKQDVQVRVARLPFTIDGKSYERGSILVLRWDNEHLDEEYSLLLNRLAAEYNRSYDIAASGLVEEGKDFGSSEYDLISAPKIALVGGSGTSSYRFGEAWYHFEQVLDYPVTVLEEGYLSRIELSEYDVVILAGGSYPSLSESTMQNLQDWIREGGRVIAMDRALNLFVDKEQFSLKSYRTPDEEEKADDQADSAKEQRLLMPYAQSERNRLSSSAYGAIFNVKVDNTHPLAFGFGTNYHSLKTTSTRYAWLTDGWNVGTLGSSVRSSGGFAGSRALQRLENTLVFGVEGQGSGDIVYFVDNPLFRAFWHNGKRLFNNAVFMPF